MPITKKIKRRIPVKPSPKKIRDKQGTNKLVVPMTELYPEDAGITILDFGMSGSGKTRFWSTFPKPILAIFFSGGAAPGEGRSISRERMKGVNVALPKHTDQVLNLIEAQEESDYYKTIVVDHVTGLQDKKLAEILDIPKLPEQKSWGMASMQDYGTCTTECKEIFRRLLSLKANIVLIGHERQNEDGVDSDDPDEAEIPSVGVALTPSLAGWLNGAVDYIVQSYKAPKFNIKTVKVKVGKKTVEKKVKEKVKGTDFRMRIGPSSIYTTKFRVPEDVILPDSISNPTYDKIMALIRG